MSKPIQCKATVWHRDTYRYTGRVKGGFEMHYSRAQCKREGAYHGYCWQHYNSVHLQKVQP